MFTGIVEETGRILQIAKSRSGIRLKIQTQKTGEQIQLGDSLAVNGACLTATEITGPKRRRIVAVDLLIETWEKTNLQHLRKGALVNLERPLKADGRLDGHMVTGHVEGLGKVHRWEKVGQDWCLEIIPPSSLMKYIVTKGSITIDGISLTVAKTLARRFRIWIIPHTYTVTPLNQIKQGDFVNLETDIIGKYVERLLAYQTGK